MKTRWPLILLILTLVSCSVQSTPEDPPSPTETPLPAAPTLTEIPWTQTPTLTHTAEPTETSPPPTNTALPAPTSTQAPLPTSPPIILSNANAIIAKIKGGPYEFFLVGGSQDGDWISAGDLADGLNVNTDYQVYFAYEFYSWYTGMSITHEHICDTYYVYLGLVPTEDSAVGVSGDWPVQPRTPLDISTDHEVYKKAVADWLVAQAPSQPIVNINRIWRVDLEGNGSEEVLLNASHFAESTGHHVEPRDYSVVLLRTVIGNDVVTKTLIGDYYPEAIEFRYPLTYTLEFVGDLNGDGKMEVVLGVSGWDSSGVMVYEIDRDQVRLVMNVLCRL